MTKWINDRPPGWCNPWREVDGIKAREVTSETAFESGATAMYHPAYDKGVEEGRRLERAALRKSGVRFKGGDPDGMSYDEFDAVMGQWRDGHVVWVPE